MPTFLRPLRLGLCVLLLASALAACVGYDSAGRIQVQDGRTRLDVAFSARDRQFVHDYYRRHMPPGLAKRSTLPPGLTKRSKLPPGLVGERLPRDLETRLARLPEGYVRLRIGTDVVLMNARTRIVFDVITGIGP